jgi:hypothetical protein
VGTVGTYFQVEAQLDDRFQSIVSVAEVVLTGSKDHLVLREAWHMSRSFESQQWTVVELLTPRGIMAIFEQIARSLCEERNKRIGSHVAVSSAIGQNPPVCAT